MDKVIENVMRKTCDELEQAMNSGKIDMKDEHDRKLVMELVDIKKNIIKIEKLETEMQGGFSAHGNSYASRGQHYVRGHYSRDSGEGSYNDGSSYGNGRSYADGQGGYSMRGSYRSGNSYADGRDKMIEHLDMAENSADNDRDREKIRRFREQLERG